MRSAEVDYQNLPWWVGKHFRTIVLALLLIYLGSVLVYVKTGSRVVSRTEVTVRYGARPGMKLSVDLSKRRDQQQAAIVLSSAASIAAKTESARVKSAASTTAKSVTTKAKAEATTAKQVPTTVTKTKAATTTPKVVPTTTKHVPPTSASTAPPTTTTPPPKSVEKKSSSSYDDIPNSALFTKRMEKHLELQKNIIAGKTPLKRAIIVRCQRNDVCAGLGDRIYGMLVLYLAAILTDRAFFIVNEKPKPMQDYVEPNQLDWRIDSIPDKAMREKVKLCAQGNGGFNSCGFFDLLMPGAQCPHVMGNVFSDRDFVIMMSDHRTECVQRMLVKHGLVPKKGDNGFDGTNPAMQGWAANVSHIMFHSLFKFKEEIVSKANKALTPPDSNAIVPSECLVCVHVRSGSGVNEGRRHTNWGDFAGCGKNAQADLEATKGCKTKPYWLIVGDNAAAPDAIKGHIDLKTISGVLTTQNLGPPTHIDQNNGASTDMVAHVFVDWNLLTRCRFFVASLSTFSGTASIAGGPSVHRFDMETNGHAGGCKRHSIADWQRDANI